MADLLKNFTIEQILLFTVLFLAVIKGTIEFILWVKKIYKNKFDKDHNELTFQETVEKRHNKYLKQHDELIKRYDSLEEKIDRLAEVMKQNTEKIEKKLSQLTASDMHDIKSFIVEKHHIYIKQGWIDDFTMDTIEKRFSDYVAEGGNSYVKGLIMELRALPHFPQ